MTGGSLVKKGNGILDLTAGESGTRGSAELRAAEGISTAKARAYVDAAIDRLVHHSVILEMTGTSVRADTAEQAKREAATTVTKTMGTKGKPTDSEGATTTVTKTTTANDRQANDEVDGEI